MGEEGTIENRDRLPGGKKKNLVDGETKERVGHKDTTTKNISKTKKRDHGSSEVRGTEKVWCTKKRAL